MRRRLPVADRLHPRSAPSSIAGTSRDDEALHLLGGTRQENVIFGPLWTGKKNMWMKEGGSSKMWAARDWFRRVMYSSINSLPARYSVNGGARKATMVSG